MDKIELLSMNQKQLSSFFAEMGEPAFRSKQVYSWLNKGADFSEMTNLPLSLRAKLEENCIANPVRIEEIRESRLDGTVKFLYCFPDHHMVEGVLMHYHYGYTLCLSTQVGCRMGCQFCASTLDGVIRNLTPGEMLGQILCANRYLATKDESAHVGNIVLMGSGEPFDNYDNVISFLRKLREPDGMNIGMRSVSLSTCGLVPQMYRFAEEGLPLTLSVSLHAWNDETRRKLMPVARTYSIDEILDACRFYIEKTGRRVIFEYALISGVNSLPEHARALAARLRHLQCHVNLIPLNDVPERGLRGVSEREVKVFLDTLTGLGISATRRREMGDDIEGACGQLRRRYLSDTDEQKSQ